MVSLSELSKPEQHRVEKAVHEVSSRAAIIGVAVTQRSWDLRPVVFLSSETQPSLVRFSGPEVTLSKIHHARIEDLFQRICGVSELQLATRILEWGIFEGQLWYRRDMVETTLADLMTEGRKQSFSEAFAIARKLARAVESLHSRGIAHGHIVPGNVVLAANGDVSLVDPGIGLAIVQSSKHLGIEQFPQGYLRPSFAPELLQSDAVLYDSDVFGVGLILKQLFAPFKRTFPDASRVSEPQVTSRLTTFADMIGSMCDANPAARPSLAKVIEMLGEQPRLGEPYRPKRELPKPEQIIGSGPIERGKVIQTVRRPEVEPAAAPERPIAPMTPEVQTPPVAPAIAEKIEPTPPPPVALAPVVAEEPARAERPREIPEVPAATTRFNNLRPRALLWPAAVLICLLLVAFVFLRRGDSSGYSPEELELAWYSNRPALMTRVAEVAVQEEGNAEAARDLILRSVIRGEQLPKTVDGSLLRVAFDPHWDAQLTPSDRRTAYALALSGLLREETPTDLTPLAQAHPGLVLAITASAGENVGRVLATVPLSVLIALPPPFGVAFQQLGVSKPDLHCGDESVRGLARLATRGIEQADAFIQFLSVDTMTRLRAVAFLFSEDNNGAQKALDILVHPTHHTAPHDVVRWAQAWNITSWKELEPSDQLLVVSGLKPSGEVLQEHLAVLFAHPEPSMRAYAIQLGLEKITFEHPGALAALTKIADKPEILTGDQTLMLARLLEMPGSVDSSIARTFLAGNPPETLIVELLLASAKTKTGTRLDFEFSRYLQQKGWEPQLSELSILLSHPDKLTRFFIYTKIFALPDRGAARKLLNEALAKESLPEFKKQLQSMLNRV